ncbi:MULTISPECIES: class I SAM-dependent methyltransferase [unclassified Halomonas]|uniref:class I SAM-dependent methyltransferase n=1 Tax=unclassified Halomonas TaxID=2609666 RepID=UPI000481988B|nr:MULTISPECIES: class I SAM-dependent methyltransferase [unclassified Halomonas]PKH60790.1 class I SAM-dependent methyltransferase [Halomonas sp. Choline-3u-9]QGQ72170.1 class I SAM-dependent methyltransferase [Halomonas sp. PA16-9]
MTPTDIGSAYDQITHLWESEKFNLANGIEAHKRALSFVKGRGKALDIGCGCTGRFIDFLQQEDFTPEGVDISDEMLRLAKQKHPDVTFHHQDICQWQPLEKYDFITAWDSIWHIPLVQQESVMTKLIGSLNKDGVLIFSFGGTDEPGEHTDSFMGPEVYYSTLGTNGFVSLLMKLGAVCRHLEYDQHPELHTYLIVQKR